MLVDTISVNLIKKPSVNIVSGSRIQTEICEGIQWLYRVQIFDGATSPVIVWENNISPPGSVYLYETVQQMAFIHYRGN